MKKFTFCYFLILLCLPVWAQIQEPVKFKTEWKSISADEAEIIFTGNIEKGWHVYSTDLPEGGPISATFNTDRMEGAETVGKLTPKGKETDMMDPIFGMQVRFFEHTATFVQKIRLTGGSYDIAGYLEYGACNDENCLPPTSVEFSFKGEAASFVTESPSAEAASSSDAQPATAMSEDTTASIPLVPLKSAFTAKTDYWKPVINELSQLGEQTNTESHSWLYIFFAGFIGGLLALFTPCVWPIIPMTVSFFLKRTKDKKKGIRDAWTYGASIVVIYLSLGLAITLIFGANALNALSTNAVFNILFFLMLVVFAASFFGAFEITLPSHIPDGLYPVTGFILMHRADYRLPACGSLYHRQCHCAGSRHVGLRHRTGFAFHCVRLIPFVAEVHAEIGRLDECHQGYIRIP